MNASFHAGLFSLSLWTGLSLVVSSLAAGPRPQSFFAASSVHGVSVWPEEHLQSLRQRGRPVIVIDVRSEVEYRVGHLPGAVHIEAGKAPRDVRARLRARVRGASVVLYCTLGPKSQHAAEALAPMFYDAGAKEVAILRRGIVGWSEAGYPVVDHRGSTPFIHPYDKSIAALLARPERARYAPRD